MVDSKMVLSQHLPGAGRRIRVLVAHVSPGELPSFIERDVQILSDEFSVRTLRFRGSQDIFQLVREVALHDVVLSWFAWDQAFWGNLVASILGHGSITIAGGFDVVGLPEIGYGNLLNRGSARRTRIALRRGTLVLAVSNSIGRNAAELSGRSNVRVVYHGFEPSRYPFGSNKQKVALTVGDVTESNLQRKGILTFVRAAKYLPDIHFIVVGQLEETALELLKPVPQNVQFLGRVSDDQLLREMMRAQVYVQVSAHEGFGCSLAEAMLCGCIPVVTNRGAIPEVVGDTGTYVPFNDARLTADAIRESMVLNEASRTQARQRIEQLFPLSARRDALVRAVHEAAS